MASCVHLSGQECSIQNCDLCDMGSEGCSYYPSDEDHSNDPDNTGCPFEEDKGE